MATRWKSVTFFTSGKTKLAFCRDGEIVNGVYEIEPTEKSASELRKSEKNQVFARQFTAVIPPKLTFQRIMRQERESFEKLFAVRSKDGKFT